MSNRTMEFWKSSRGTVVQIEVVVVVITVMQLFLAILGSWRRWSRNLFIQKGVFAAYTLSSSLISYTLGSMQSSAVKSHMYMLWTISLFILFSCADSVTAYSLTDNSQTTRQIFQSALVFSYVIFMLITIGLKMPFLCLCLSVVPIGLLISGGCFSVFQRLSACGLASESWVLNRMVADYMYQEHIMGESPYLYDPDSMRGYHYLVDFPADMLRVVDRSIRSDQITDIEMVWQSDGGTLLSPYLKDACLSFSLFHLLRRRFFGFDCVESPQQKTHDFVFRGLLAKNEAGAMDFNRVFKVIEVELAFMYDFFFTKYAAIYYGNSFFRHVVPLSSATSAFVLGFLMAVGLLLLLPSPSGFSLENTAADVGVTAAILVCISVLKVVQVLYYWTTIWGRVSFACQRMKGGGGCMGLQDFFVNIGVFMSGCCWYRHGEKLWQYSLLESLSNISNQSMVTNCLAICEISLENLFHAMQDWVVHGHVPNDLWCVIRKPGKPAKLLPAVKKALVQSLELTQGKLTNGQSSLSSNTAADLLWACEQRLLGSTVSSQKAENQVYVILTWHIATCYCNKELSDGTGITQELTEHHEVATILSKYTAYLVGFQPKLLPGHHFETWTVFNEVAAEAIRQSEGIHQDDETIYGKGLRLGEQLKNMEAARCWKILADFWAELLLYLAPSDNVKEHVECLAKGGELITHLWALLTHAGILDRGKRNNVTNDTEDPGEAPTPSSYTNQPPTTRNPTTQRTERDVGETRDSGSDESNLSKFSNTAALRLQHVTSYLDDCVEGASSAATRATNNPALLGNCSQTVGMTVHQPASPVQNGQGAPNDGSTGLNEIEEIA